MDKRRYKVVKDRVAETDNPIRVSTGDLLEYVESSDPDGSWPDWVYCRSKEKEGWIPRQIIEIEDERVRVLENYDARELTITTGESYITIKLMNGWLWGYPDGKPQELGWVPLNYLIPEEHKDLIIFDMGNTLLDFHAGEHTD